MAMTRVCDICKGERAMLKAYQFSTPAILTDNVGAEGGDSSMTDVCDQCIASKQVEVVAKLVTKATSVG